MSKFEDDVKHFAEESVLRIVAEGGWIMPNYENRIKIPASIQEDVWGMIDQESLKKKLADRIEAELADRIVNHLASEIATDIKKVLSIPERREALRAVARENIDRICNPKKED
jgi:hypothetical protein